MVNYTTVTSDKSKKTALILCALGGFFGLHQYYVGKIGTGSFKDNAGAPLRA